MLGFDSEAESGCEDLTRAVLEIEEHDLRLRDEGAFAKLNEKG